MAAPPSPRPRFDTDPGSQELPVYAIGKNDIRDERCDSDCLSLRHSWNCNLHRAGSSRAQTPAFGAMHPCSQQSGEIRLTLVRALSINQVDLSFSRLARVSGFFASSIASAYSRWCE